MKNVIILALLLISINIIAQEDPEPTRVHEFGIHAGFVSGVGLSYRYWPQKLGVQITALPVKTDEVTFISVGVTGLYSFYESRRVRFFGYFGNHLLYKRDRDYTYSYGYQYEYYEYKKKTEYNLGFGPGFGFGTRVRFNIMAGYGLYDIFGKLNIMPTAEIGLYYRL